jgi:chorismate dehydratase
MEIIRISAVSYLNTKPFLWGINHSKIINQFNVELNTDLPSECARKLMEGEADIGLIPVAVLPKLKSYQIISEHCIGADGPVKTVMLYSKVPLKQIKKIYLDYQSKTSVKLVRVLAKEFWNISPEFSPAMQGFETQINGKDAGVVIGDRTFSMNGNFPFEWDLAQEWKKMTGLPFVFACWVTTKKLPDDFIYAFNKALKIGIENIQEVTAGLSDKQMLQEYFTRYISYSLDERKKRALKLFLQKISELE